MVMNASKCLFLMLLVGGAVMATSSDSWFGAWCGLELNLMSFVPFICIQNDIYSSECSLKYFLVQALGSANIIVSAVCISFFFQMKWVIALALLLKMGAAPLHFWFPAVMSGLSWGSCFVLVSVQKIAPLVILTYVVGDSKLSAVISLSIVLSVLIGSVGGLNQVFLRKIMAYSSINHLSWMIAAMLLSDCSWVVYYIFYVVISGSVMYLFYTQQMYHISHLVSSGWSFLGMVNYMSLLSLGGLPPFTGFIPKWLVIQEMVSTHSFFFLFVLLTGTLISLYYYLRLIFSNLVLSSVLLKWSKEDCVTNKKMSFFVFLTLMMLFVPSLFMIV